VFELNGEDEVYSTLRGDLAAMIHVLGRFMVGPEHGQRSRIRDKVIASHCGDILSASQLNRKHQCEGLVDPEVAQRLDVREV